MKLFFIEYYNKITMTGFDCLPFDVIDYILNCENISFVDVCRLACVSKIFNCVAKSNILWKKKYTQMWPYLASLFDAENTDWKQEFHLRYNLKKKLAEKLTDLSEEFYHQEHVSNDAFLYFKDISRDHPLGYDMIINELENIIEDSDTHLNLTHRYYSRRALRYMRHVQLENIWQDFLSQPPNKMTLLKGACLVSQWCHATFSKCTSNVESQIDDIVNQVFERVKEQFPKHPIIKHRFLPSDEVLVKSLWTPRQCKNILICIMDVMVKDMKFGGTANHAYSAHNIYVETVLSEKEGLSITLGIIFATVAGKLGVACLPVNFPGYFLLKWLEHPQLDEKDAYSYIDVFDSGSFKTVKDLCDLAPGYENISPSWIEAVPYIKVFIRMTWYIVEFKRQCESGPEDSLSLCSALELLCLLSPDDMEHKLLLARLYMHLGINVTEAISMLQEIAAHDPMSPLIMGYMYQSTLNTLETQKVSRPPIKIKCQLRDGPTDVKFAIGMIMKHKKYRFRCVIYGWDYVSTASKDWNQRMGVYKLEHKDKQPFYYVLVDDSTTRYAAQENLKIDTKLRAKPINNHRIGRFFESYHGRYYLPNASTLAEYPHDIEAREKALSSLEVE